MSLIVLTGASGYISQNLTQFFNKKSKKNKTISLRFQNWHKMMPNETDTIIHLAAIKNSTFENAYDEDYFRVNTELTSKLFRYFQNSNASTFIFLSTTELVDKNVNLITETSKVNLSDPFLKSKFEAEQFIMNQTLPEGKRAIILRLAPVYGRETISSLYKTFSYCKKMPWFFGALQTKKSYCNIDNLIEIIQQIIDTPTFSSGIYNVADEEPIDSLQFVNWTSEVVEKKVSIYKIPVVILNFFAKVGTLLNWKFNMKKVYENSHSRVVNCDKIKRELDRNQMPFDTKLTVIKTLEYYNSIKI